MATLFTGTALASDDTGWENAAIRTACPTSGSLLAQFRCTLEAHSSSNTKFDNVSLGAWDNGTANNYDTIATPDELLFSAASGKIITAANTATSDWATIVNTTSNPNNYLVVCMDYGSTLGNMRYVGGTSASTSWKFAADSYNIADWSPTSAFSGRLCHVTSIETQSVSVSRGGGKLLMGVGHSPCRAKLAAPNVQTYSRETLWRPSRYIETRPRLVFPGYK